MTESREKVSVLFVCMGNICRSPTAEGVFRHFVAVPITSVSRLTGAHKRRRRAADSRSPTFVHGVSLRRILSDSITS
jgi:protein-tyrosine-phosphatase